MRTVLRIRTSSRDTGVPSSRMTRSPAARFPGVWPLHETSKMVK